MGSWGLQVDFYYYIRKVDIKEKEGHCFFSFWFFSIFAVRKLNNDCLSWGHQMLYCAPLLNTQSCLEKILYTVKTSIMQFPGYTKVIIVCTIFNRQCNYIYVILSEALTIVRTVNNKYKDLSQCYLSITQLPPSDHN